MIIANATDKEITITIDGDVWASYCKWAETHQSVNPGETPLAGDDAGIEFFSRQIARFDRAQQKADQPPTIVTRPGIKDKVVK